MNKEHIIVCPHCGCEYLPNEIFYPKDLLGDATNIVRDENGKIISFIGNNMQLSEEYICDKCDHSFIVTMTVSFIVNKNVEKDFDDEFTVSLGE